MRHFIETLMFIFFYLGHGSPITLHHPSVPAPAPLFNIRTYCGPSVNKLDGSGWFFNDFLAFQVVLGTSGCFFGHSM